MSLNAKFQIDLSIDSEIVTTALAIELPYVLEEILCISSNFISSDNTTKTYIVPLTFHNTSDTNLIITIFNYAKKDL
jgi:hypothetical protein